MSDDLNWRVSSFTVDNNCVEVADDGHVIHVRNSNARDAGTLNLTRAQMAAFVEGCRAGEFDDLV